MKQTTYKDIPKGYKKVINYPAHQSVITGIGTVMQNRDGEITVYDAQGYKCYVGIVLDEGTPIDIIKALGDSQEMWLASKLMPLCTMHYARSSEFAIMSTIKLEAGYGYWKVSVHSIGGDFHRAGSDGLPLRTLEVRPVSFHGIDYRYGTTTDDISVAVPAEHVIINGE